MLTLNMMLGEVAPGGAGSGLYGLLMMTLLAVFLGGLMIGRTPEYLKQRLHSRHMKLVSLYLLTLPAVALIGTAAAMALPGERASMLNAGPHGLSEVLYAFTGAAANNGSAFAGLSGNTTRYNIVLALAMVVGRFLPTIAVLGIAGTFAAQQAGVITAGTLRTHTPTFVFLIASATLLIVGLEYLPALALGPTADALLRSAVRYRRAPRSSESGSRPNWFCGNRISVLECRSSSARPPTPDGVESAVSVSLNP